MLNVTKIWKSNCNKTQLILWQYSKTQIVTNQKLQIWRRKKLKIQIVTTEGRKNPIIQIVTKFKDLIQDKPKTQIMTILKFFDVILITAPWITLNLLELSMPIIFFQTGEGARTRVAGTPQTGKNQWRQGLEKNVPGNYFSVFCSIQ